MAVRDCNYIRVTGMGNEKIEFYTIGKELERREVVMPAKFHELDTQELIRRYESGESAPKIAVAMGIGETSVYNYFF